MRGAISIDLYVILNKATVLVMSPKVLLYSYYLCISGHGHRKKKFLSDFHHHYSLCYFRMQGKGFRDVVTQKGTYWAKLMMIVIRCASDSKLV